MRRKFSLVYGYAMNLYGIHPGINVTANLNKIQLCKILFVQIVVT